MTSLLTTVNTWGTMIKFSHSVFALPFAVISAFLAGRQLPERTVPYAGQLLLIVVCMVAARSVAMTFNRIVDARIDAANPRTAGRPIPAGRISMRAAAAFLAIAAGVFLLACGAFYAAYENPWPLWLGVPTLAFLCAYSYTKRFTRWSHFFLGTAIALSPPAAWIAIDPTSFGWPAIMLMAAVTLWIAGFDIIYACQDIDVDREQGLFSLPSRIGPGPALWIARACHAGTVALLLLLGHVAQLGWLYYGGVAVVAVLLLVENSLVRAGDYSKVNIAFFTINGIVSVLMGSLAVADILLGMRPVFG
jgi:4-hydroxybenzoate polyprenyltransferase